ncbi:MAG: glycosyltransferase [bacterium]
MTTLQTEKIRTVAKSPSHASNGRRKLKIAYTMSRFPKLTETFILYEILALEKMGVQVEIFPLIHEKQSVMHPEAQKMVRRAWFLPIISLSILAAHFHYLFHKPKAYLKVLFEVLTGTFGSLNFFLGALGLFPKTVCMALAMERLGIMHLHAHFSNHPALAALIVHRLTGIPYSFTAHGSDLHVERRMLDRKVAASAFAVAISQYNKKVMLRECGEKMHGKIHVVHCGVDVDEFTPSQKIKNGRPFQILCVASFEEVKGHQYLVEACKLLVKDGISFQCHLVGYGPLKNKVRRQVKEAGLQDKILIYSALPRPEILKMHALADVKVLPSVPTRQGKREGIPVVLMEAMASGLAVVSSKLSGIPELVENGETGLLVAPGDVPALADALKWLSMDPILRKKMGEAARERVVRKFNLHKNARKLAHLFLANLNRNVGN